ncbi:MAG: hypothetical protein ACOCZ5_00015 [bacterium]
MFTKEEVEVKINMLSKELEKANKIIEEANDIMIKHREIALRLSGGIQILKNMIDDKDKLKEEVKSDEVKKQNKQKIVKT